MDRHNKKLIHINSNHNLTNNKSDAVFDFSEIELQEAYAVRLKDISITNLLYNVYVKNNVLDYDFGGIPKSIVIPPGNYTSTTLQNVINGLQTDLVFSQSSASFKFSVTSASLSFLKSSSTIKSVLGFVDTGTASLSYELPLPFDLVRSHYINILSNLADSGNCFTSNKQNYGLIAQIPVNLPFGFILNQSQEKDSSDSHKFDSHVNLSQVRIKLADDNFEEIDINDAKYTITFNVFTR
jgi:hypothetical protein